MIESSIRKNENSKLLLLFSYGKFTKTQFSKNKMRKIDKIDKQGVE